MTNEKQPDVFDTGARTPQQIQYAKDLKDASIAAMQGLLSGDTEGGYSEEDVVKMSLSQAKALLKRLEEESK